MSPTAFYGLAAACGVVILALLLAVSGGWHPALAYLAAINLTTLALYSYDKLIAGSSLVRVPESVLQGLAFLGGSPAAFAAQKVLRHKTRKTSFQKTYWTIVFLQLLLIGLIVWLAVRRP
ncbi:DUF1294 domain-containing protein [Thermogemmata fonticola]|jgi:uncharacterized membrane protein YsdA (DUF1294 family)|uniref:DUF1294 domain-containing protein n=1 Tax=Thermogemmata fonticola TaxID=2755323 RepID=A0A7V8VFH8_9BACT|nr:DUF1294 domain-containing protein [Thermogemmata fonticola]MBA2227006.1 DUF1294 domain-containing protein [Thermogemmata fonticola]